MTERYFLKSSVQWFLSEGDGVTVIGRKSKFYPRGSDRLVQILESLRKGASMDDLITMLGTEENALRVINKFRQNGFLKLATPWQQRSDHLEKQAEFFSEYIEDVDASLRKLETAHVLIVGCGGTGAMVAQSLASAGVGRITGIDDDVVQLSNLNRQYAYCSADIGRNKPEALGAFLKSRWPNVSFTARAGRIETEDDLNLLLAGQQIDLVICCADTPPIIIQKVLCSWARKNGSSILFGAVGLSNGHVGPLLTDSQSMLSYEQLLERAVDKVVQAQLKPQSGSIGWTNSLISALISGEATRFLSGYLPPSTRNDILEYDFEDNTISRRKFK